MLHTIDEFMEYWEQESGNTKKVMAALTDASLAQSVAADHRTLARMAWHIIGTLQEVAKRTGLKLDSPQQSDPIPAAAEEIIKSYERAADSLAEQIKANWTDETLQIEDDLIGETWKRGKTLAVVIMHEIHHRGQMTVLMRQAGLTIPGIYGPAKDEWVNYNRQPPAV